MDDYTDLIMRCAFHGMVLEELFLPPNSVCFRCPACDRQLQVMINGLLKPNDADEGGKNGGSFDDVFR